MPPHPPPLGRRRGGGRTVLRRPPPRLEPYLLPLHPSHPSHLPPPTMGRRGSGGHLSSDPGRMRPLQFLVWRLSYWGGIALGGVTRSSVASHGRVFAATCRRRGRKASRASRLVASRYAAPAGGAATPSRTRPHSGCPPAPAAPDCQERPCRFFDVCAQAVSFIKQGELATMYGGELQFHPGRGNACTLNKSASSHMLCDDASHLMHLPGAMDLVVDALPVRERLPSHMMGGLMNARKGGNMLKVRTHSSHSARTLHCTCALSLLWRVHCVWCRKGTSGGTTPKGGLGRR